MFNCCTSYFLLCSVCEVSVVFLLCPYNTYKNTMIQTGTSFILVGSNIFQTVVKIYKPTTFENPEWGTRRETRGVDLFNHRVHDRGNSNRLSSLAHSGKGVERVLGSGTGWGSDGIFRLRSE